MKYSQQVILVTIIFLGVMGISTYVSADSYDGPFCFEKPDRTNASFPDSDNVRGTCKEVKTITIVSLDPTLKKDYFLGTHEPVRYGCHRSYCQSSTIYSKHLFLTSSSTIETQTTGVEESPLQYALFKKSYFVPLLSKMFKASAVPFSENTLPGVWIGVFKQSELDEIKKVEGDYPQTIPTDAKMDSLRVKKDSYTEPYFIYSLNYQEYGKYIYAPKTTLVEPQYADFEKAGNLLSNKDLQITIYRGGAQISAVPITSPLQSVRNYWTYTNKAGKLVLSWQKSEYVLDNGKVLTSGDRNITTTLLLSNPLSASKPTESVSPTATTSTALPPEQKQGFFDRLLDFILSWFR